MRSLPIFAMLLLAACGAQTPPNSTPQPTPASTTSLPPFEHQHNNLIGMSANDLVEHFGTPRLQVREGDGTKLQFATDICLLDAYLYPGPSGGGLPRVTYVDTYRRDGRSISAQDCATAIETR